MDFYDGARKIFVEKEMKKMMAMIFTLFILYYTYTQSIKIEIWKKLGKMFLKKNPQSKYKIELVIYRLESQEYKWCALEEKFNKLPLIFNLQ